MSKDRALASLMPADTFNTHAPRSMTSTQEPRLNDGNPATELNAEQALGLVSYGLMQRLAGEGHVELPWLPSQNEDKAQNLHQLRQRLELTALALETGAPLSTAEVGFLLGARPGTEQVERGGLSAKRVSRNVWRLTKIDDSEGRSGGSFADERFRRRL